MPHIPLCLVCRRDKRVGVWGSVHRRRVQVGFQQYRIVSPFDGILAQCPVVEMMGARMGSSGLVGLVQVLVSVLFPCLRVVHGRHALGHCHMRFVHFSHPYDGFSHLSDVSTYGAVLVWG